MLSREQIYTLIWIRKQPGNIFAVLPKEMCGYGMANVSHDSGSEIAELLKHIIAGTHLHLIRGMLWKNPRLVLEAGDVTTSAGLLVKRTTPLECALGAGSPEISEMIHDAFERIRDEKDSIVEGAIKVRNEQYARYRKHIEGMLNYKPYDFTWLLEVIKASHPEDITAALNNDMSRQNKLTDALLRFRKQFTPDKIAVGMHFNYNEHCNYQTIIRAFEIADLEYNNLVEGVNVSKYRLFAKHIVDVIALNCCSEERFLFARDCFDNAIAGKLHRFDRQLIYKYREWATQQGLGDFGPTAIAALTAPDIRAKDLKLFFEKKQQDLLDLVNRNDNQDRNDAQPLEYSVDMTVTSNLSL